MRHLLTLTMLCFASVLAAEDFTTDAAKTAKAAYESDLKAAREKYQQSLTEAAQAAIADGETDELARITEAIQTVGEPDPLEKAKQAVMEKTFEDEKGVQRRFLANGKTWSKSPGRKASSGDSVWQMLDELTLLTKGQGVDSNYFVWRFSDDYESYTTIRLIHDAKVLSKANQAGVGRGKAVK